MSRPLEVTRQLMGSRFTLAIYPDRQAYTPSALRELLEVGLNEVARLEDLLTDFRPSPLNAINDQAGVRPVEVTEEIFRLLEFSQQVARDSEGAFDITYAAVGQLWRRAFQEGQPPAEEELARYRPLVDYRLLRLDPAARTAFLPRTGMRLGLGGVGKGYAVDRVYELLRRLGLKNFIVNGAGDIRLHSDASAPRPWKIGIRNPLASAPLPMGYLTLSQGAVATSGDYERYLKYRGQRLHHILDARTATIRQDVAAVTVRAATALEADVFATTVMALGVEQGAAFLNHRRGVEGFIVTPSGTVLECGIQNQEAKTHHALV
jgi:FAD:protein FMN transferase